MGDSYRPRRGPGPDPRADRDSYYPTRHNHHSRPPWPPADANREMYYFQGNRNNDDRSDNSYRPKSRDFSARNETPRRDHFRRLPPVNKIAERPLLKLKHDEDENLALMGPNVESKFRNLDELTDSEEEAMAQSEDDLEGSERTAKRLRADSSAASTAHLPKWSNPDPYTSLPPPADQTTKRTDVLKLIRKARIGAARNSQKAANEDDFISFDVGEGDKEEDSTHSEPVMAPRALTEDKVLGKRKRGDTHGQPEAARSKNEIYADKMVRKEWAVAQGIHSTPWLTTLNSTDSPGIALHKEIIDFYDWVRPKDYEQKVRADVLERLSRDLRRLMPGELKPFGSYAVGLYLPTGDMDLVFFTRDYRPGVLPTKSDVRRPLQIFTKFLRQRNIAKPGSIVAIARAKVPIIKFVDRVSGLKVDLCFDNDSGVATIDTVQTWKKAYPVMPIIVSIVKQYLMIRGLNDVSRGGLGGFSTICLVTSFLQHLPAPKHPMNLGQVLVEFFNYYGNLFDKNSVAIRLDPPTYLDKGFFAPRSRDQTGRLTIIDPNRADNNISGGTALINDIIKCFSKSHRALLERLAAYEKRGSQDPPTSFLECLIGGNYTPYETQRKMLHDLSPTSKIQPTPSTNRGPIFGMEQGSKTNAPNGDPSSLESKPLTKGEKRAHRLKALRPELAPSIRNSISLADALKLGGYDSAEVMDKDLRIREVALQKVAAAKRK
ncbi:uncharacterized protein Z518_08287 [Rhinocladiella mackenziei CBS 650.93]|uniref:polynucleotide adenylyltransferase n=1 Tax=Rhinocladiella mackenziei CBS 650.93 TaxID=1442369 RepID=A0A0D2IGE0_9EURO|nr:uncharacterized protein Z518_08287 [Rhinocladiella mackenziei CBS 650.93]KIX02346.1 hypothetical protein Z518_08287 [Rhinocladiella mackenziei CBS 650.93]